MDPLDAIKDTFFQECEEQLAELESGLLAIEEGDHDPERINAVFRAVHSVKGGAGAFGLEPLVRFAHVFETALDQMRSGGLAPDDHVLKVMLRAADVLADHRVGLTDDDPPYYAYLALSSESIELGAGVSYLIPKSTGTVLNLNAVLEAAFFFHNSSAWYVHFGTKEKPVTARIISMFDGYSYLMLSASGIETGTGVHFDFNKSYGPVCIAAHAYLDLWAHISFERFQAGGGIALGGYVDVRVFRFGLFRCSKGRSTR